jgi:hypothetical protein
LIAACFPFVGLKDFFQSSQQRVQTKQGSVTIYFFQGADVSLRCRWTDMLPVHYAAFFNAASVIRVLLKASGSKGIIHFVNFSFCLLAVLVNRPFRG